MSDHKMALLALKISDRYHQVWGLLCLIAGILIFGLKPEAELAFLAMLDNDADFSVIYLQIFLTTGKLFLWLYYAAGALKALDFIGLRAILSTRKNHYIPLSPRTWGHSYIISAEIYHLNGENNIRHLPYFQIKNVLSLSNMPKQNINGISAFNSGAPAR